MEALVNYLDIPTEKRDDLLKGLLQTSFCPAQGGLKELKETMERAQRGRLPQYLFLLRDGRVIGYSFLIGEEERKGELFPWWAVDNSDELPLQTGVSLLEQAAAVSSSCGAPVLADRLLRQIEPLRQRRAAQALK